MTDSSMTSRAGVVFEGQVFSPALQTNRMVRIYLPESYDRDRKQRYPVLYLHDGQNVFTTVGPHVAFGWGNWELDKTAAQLAADRRMKEIIMVAVDCSPQRYQDYRGPAPSGANLQSTASQNPPLASADNTRYENYARFLIQELKPKIDREYRTLSGARHTAVMGSSMGGICSLALAWQYPEVFGSAASLSGAFQVERKHFLQNVLGIYRGKRKPIRIYLDSGVTDFTGGDDGREHTDAVARELRRIGWREGVNLLHYTDAEPLKQPELEKAGLRGDKIKEAHTSQHNEFYWRLRAWRPLTFLFPSER